MTPAITAITQFTIALICGLLFFSAFQRHHHRVFFVMIIPTITSLIFGFKALGIF
jgi:hypothetical protein